MFCSYFLWFDWTDLSKRRTRNQLSWSLWSISPHLPWHLPKLRVVNMVQTGSVIYSWPLVRCEACRTGTSEVKSKVHLACVCDSCTCTNIGIQIWILFILLCEDFLLVMHSHHKKLCKRYCRICCWSVVPCRPLLQQSAWLSSPAQPSVAAVMETFTDNSDG